MRKRKKRRKRVFRKGRIYSRVSDFRSTAVKDISWDDFEKNIDPRYLTRIKTRVHR